ncbi:MAG TPA: hypothetical protein VIM96_03040 [Pseudomonadales bacterium]
MMSIKTIGLCVTAAFLLACASNTKPPLEASPAVEKTPPPIVAHLPHRIGGYEYAGFTEYGPGLGYSLRYIKKGLQGNYADIYIWPVPKEAQKYSHEEIVYGVTEGSLQDIYEMQNRGIYEKVELIDRLAYGSSEQLVTMHRLVMLRENRKTLSFLYLTEYQGRLLKARVSLPDNEANRSSDEVKQFVLEIFNRIIANTHER